MPPDPTTASRPTTWITNSAVVCGGEISYLKGGHGAAVLVLPRENGHPPRNEFLDVLAEEFTVYYPWLPGFYGSQPGGWNWLESVRDVAVLLRQFVQELGLDRLSVVGLGFGGWLAAEMATMSSDGIDQLILVAPMGIQPKNGYIHDQFLSSTENYARLAFADQAAFDAIYGAELEFSQFDAWEYDREMTCRVAWKPYMYNPTLPKLLRGVAVPALIVWGDADRIVPAECGPLYQTALPNATLEVIAGAGHAVELEQPVALSTTVRAFLHARTAEQK